MSVPLYTIHNEKHHTHMTLLQQNNYENIKNITVFLTYLHVNVEVTKPEYGLDKDNDLKKDFKRQIKTVIRPTQQGES